MKLGMFLPEFPTQTHIFFWREIVVLRNLGVDVVLFSTRRPTDPCPHAFGSGAARETHYVFPPHASNVASVAVQPGALRRVLRYVASLSGGLLNRMKAAALIPSAAELARVARSQGIDHIHTHSCANAAHIAAMARLLGGPPYSLHLHGDSALYGSDHAQKARLASFVAAAAAPLESQLRVQMALPPQRIRILPMGVDTDRFRPATNLRPEGGPLHIITVARLSTGKGHAFGLAAMRAALDRGADLVYDIVGSGPDRAAIEKEIARQRLQGKVRLLGALDEDAVIEALHECDVLLLSSTGVFEASPVAVMEAMACGLAVVVSRIGGTTDMIEDGVDGLLTDQRDVRGIAAALEQLSLDPALRRRLGDAARKRAVARFDSRARARQLLEAISRTSAPQRDGAEDVAVPASA